MQVTSSPARPRALGGCAQGPSWALLGVVSAGFPQFCSGTPAPSGHWENSPSSRALLMGSGVQQG